MFRFNIDLNLSVFYEIGLSVEKKRKDILFSSDFKFFRLRNYYFRKYTK